MIKKFKQFINESNQDKLILYHGTKLDFNEFDLKKFGWGSGDGGWLGYGIYLTNDYDYAESYAKNGYLLTCEIQINNPYILTDFRYSYQPLRLNNELETFNSKATTKKLKEMGYDSVMLNYDNTEFNGPEDFIEVCVFNPEQIKILDKKVKKIEDEDD